MNIIDIKSENIFIIRVMVKTNAKRQEIIRSNNEDYILIKLYSKPLQNKANKELINLFKKKLKISLNQIHIISGAKNQNKIIQITSNKIKDKNEILNKLFA